MLEYGPPMWGTGLPWPGNHRAHHTSHESTFPSNPGDRRDFVSSALGCSAGCSAWCTVVLTEYLLNGCQTPC